MGDSEHPAIGIVISKIGWGDKPSNPKWKENFDPWGVDKHFKCEVPAWLTDEQVLPWLQQELGASNIRQSSPGQPFVTPTGRYIKWISPVSHRFNEGAISLSEIVRLLNAPSLNIGWNDQNFFQKMAFLPNRLAYAETMWLDCYNTSPNLDIAIQLRDDIQNSSHSYLVAWAHGINLEWTKQFYQDKTTYLYRATGSVNATLKNGSRWVIRGTNTWEDSFDRAIQWQPVEDFEPATLPSRDITSNRFNWLKSIYDKIFALV